MNEIKVLLIDDSETDVLLLIRELKKAGYEVKYRRVDTPGNMDAALRDGAWDIILCDYVIPGWSGLEALHRVRELGIETPVIVLSGHVGEDMVVGAMRAGANDYIMKDNLRRLASAVERELREASARSESKIVERELQKTTRELELVRKMDQLKDEFIGMISHEMRNPLTVLLGNLSVLKEGEGLSPDDVSVLTDGAYHEAHELGTILDNLLELARDRADRLQLKSEVLSLPSVIDEVVASLNPGDKERILFDGSRDVLPVEGDVVRLERILSNLISNALKYSPSNSKVKITVVNVADRKVMVTVSDHGIGIPESEQKDLFKLFSRLETGKAYAGGTGLGLVVCQRLCQAMGGRIWVDSTVGKGSAFHFTVPAAVDIGMVPANVSESPA